MDVTEAKRSALDKWYKDEVLSIAGVNPSMRSEIEIPILVSLEELKHTTRLDAATYFEGKMIVFNEAFLRDSSVDDSRIGTLKETLLHQFAHCIKGQPEAHESVWAGFYGQLCRDLRVQPDIPGIYDSQDLRNDCKNDIQDTLRVLLKDRLRKARYRRS